MTLMFQVSRQIEDEAFESVDLVLRHLHTAGTAIPDEIEPPLEKPGA